jgi:hypothetical protein
MGTPSLRRVAVVATAVFGLASCENRHDAADEQQQQSVSYAAREPGSTAAPTNEASFRLLELTDQERFAALQALIVKSGKQCASVARGVFEDGWDGADEWHVDCADTGRWQLWFNVDNTIDVAHCANADCT